MLPQQVATFLIVLQTPKKTNKQQPDFTSASKCRLCK